jgi:hypothetical protein
MALVAAVAATSAAAAHLIMPAVAVVPHIPTQYCVQVYFIPRDIPVLMATGR